MKTPVSQRVRYSSMGERMDPSVITDLMARALENRDILSIAAGFTDNSILPKQLVREAVLALTEADAPNGILQYGLNQGKLGLREEIRQWLEGFPGERGGCIGTDQLIVSNGSQQSLYLAMQTLCDPGDIVLVERPSYFVFLEMLKGLGIEAVGMPSLPDGRIDLEGTAGLFDDLKYSGKWNRVKALYLIGYFANPSSRCVPEADKVELAKLMDEKDLFVPVLEDAAYRDLYFKEPYPARSIFSLEAYDPLPKLFLGTFTKPFATGMKVGYGVCSDAHWLEKMLSTKGHHDFGTSHFSQGIIEYVLKQGLYESYLQHQRKHYSEKADMMDEALEATGIRDLGWAWDKPEGGLLMWLRGPEHIDTRIGQPFCETCIDRGVLYVPGDLSFTGNEPDNCVRLSYGALESDRLVEASRRFGEVAKTFS